MNPYRMSGATTLSVAPLERKVSQETNAALFAQQLAAAKERKNG